VLLLNLAKEIEKGKCRNGKDYFINIDDEF
jgi:hypothetical protein